MPRVKRSVHARKKRRKVLEQAKGYCGPQEHALPLREGAGRALARLRLPRPAEQEAELPLALDHPHQRRGPGERALVQPVHRRPAQGRDRARPQVARRPRRRAIRRRSPRSPRRPRRPSRRRTEGSLTSLAEVSAAKRSISRRSARRSDARLAGRLARSRAARRSAIRPTPTIRCGSKRPTPTGSRVAAAARRARLPWHWLDWHDHVSRQREAEARPQAPGQRKHRDETGLFVVEGRISSRRLRARGSSPSSSSSPARRSLPDCSRVSRRCRTPRARSASIAGPTCRAAYATSVSRSGASPIRATSGR